MSGSHRVTLTIAALFGAGCVAGCGAGSAQRAQLAGSPISVVGSGHATVYTGARPYVDSAGWSLVYTRAMHLERSSSGPGLATFTEVTIATFAPARGVHTGRTRDGGFVRLVPPVGPTGRFPSDGVAFRILRVDGGPPPIVTVPDSRFPIRLVTFQRSRLPHGVRFNATTGETVADSRYKGVPPSVVRSVEADGGGYTAVAWIGRAASPRLRAALARVIASLSFPRLRPGTMVGGLTVLARAGRYPVGSFTLVHAQGLVCDRDPRRCQWSARAPFYLVHAPGRLREPGLLAPCTPQGSCISPGGFYAIGWTDEQVIGGYRSRCDLRLDRTHDQFYCTNLDARWDRVGRVIKRPQGARSGDPLQFALAKIAWDGHVLFAAGIDENPPRRRAVQVLWPGWHPAR